MPERPSTQVSRLSRAFPEKSVLIRSDANRSYVRLSPRRQIAATFLGGGLFLWACLSTGLYLVEAFERADDRAALHETTALYEARVATLAEAARKAAQARAEAESRAVAAFEELAARHETLSAATAEARALRDERDRMRSALAELRATSADALAAQSEKRAALAEAQAALDELEAERRDLADTLMRVAEALDTAALARDDAQADAAEIAVALGALETTVEERRDAQARLLARIEEAAEASIGSLESVLRGAGVDVDKVMRDLRRDGAGGPFLPAVDAAMALPPEDKAAAKQVMSDLERVKLLRAAARRMPFGEPVTARHRITSGFGMRRDPFNGRRSMHTGVDLAAARGTPVHNAADGVVVFAGRQRGYGNIVKIRHDFGFETVYAHLDRIRVRKGQTLRRGARVGDLGNTGRSTGPHLHYEVRVKGKPVNPSKFIEAARHVDVL